MMADPSGRPQVGGVAQRRRERRLRSMLRHEQQTVRTALATPLHHSQGKVHAEYGALRGLMTITRAREEGHEDTHLASRRHLAEFAPMVQILDAPVPQFPDQLMDFFKASDSATPEQVIAVPKFLQDSIPPRTLLSEPQMAEQLVEVPTVVSPSFFVEQNSDIPVPGARLRLRGDLQGFHTGQGSTAPFGADLEQENSDIPVPGACSLRKRRERRLRQFLRHVRLSVAVALAESNHHAAPRKAEDGQEQVARCGAACRLCSRGADCRRSCATGGHACCCATTGALAGRDSAESVGDPQLALSLGQVDDMPAGVSPFLGPCTQVHGQGCPPPLGRGRGGGTPGACSQAFCHPIRCT